MRWLPTVSAHVQGHPLLELGCGRGEDTAVLCHAGFSVCAVDLSERWLRQARRRARGATLYCQDLREEFPLERTGVVVASLSLHYFRWEETATLVNRIQRTLMPGGLLLCRFNSTRDTHFGANGHEMIEPGLYRVGGQPKRFFDEATIRQLFDQWSILGIEERVTYRYVLPKFVWEVALVAPATQI